MWSVICHFRHFRLVYSVDTTPQNTLRFVFVFSLHTAIIISSISSGFRMNILFSDKLMERRHFLVRNTDIYYACQSTQKEIYIENSMHST